MARPRITLRPSKFWGVAGLSGLAWTSVLVITPLRPAHATTTVAKADRDRARQAFAEAEAAFGKGDFALALQKFEAAQTIAFSPVVDFNIAVCLERLAQPEEARRAYTRVADDVTVPADVRERALRAARALQPAETPQPPPKRAGAALAEPLPSLRPPPPSVPGLALTNPSQSNADPWFSSVGWTGLAATGVGIIGASTLWILGSANRDAFNEETDPKRMGTDLERAQTLADRGDSYDVTWKLSLGVAIAGGVTLLVDRLWLHPRR